MRNLVRDLVHVYVVPEDLARRYVIDPASDLVPPGSAIT